MAKGRKHPIQSPAESQAAAATGAPALPTPGAPAIIAAVLLAGVFVWSYWPDLMELVRTWMDEPDYSHGFFVLPIAIYFLWARRDKFPADARGPGWPGLALIAFAFVMRVLSERFYIVELASWSIIPWVAGVCWLFGGRRFFMWTLPSVAFLFFMMKLPFRAETLLGHPLRRIATESSCLVLQSLGQPAFPEGTTILLGEHELGVAQACAGLRMGMGIVALAYAYILLVQRPVWQKVVLAISAPVVATLANCLRITATGLLYQYASGETARAFSHDAAGWVTIPVAAGLFFLVLWFLDHATMRVPVEPSPAVNMAR